MPPITEATTSEKAKTTTSINGNVGVEGPGGAGDGDTTETTAVDILQPTLTKIFDSIYASLNQIIRQNVRKLPFLDNDAGTCSEAMEITMEGIDSAATGGREGSGSSITATGEINNNNRKDTQAQAQHHLSGEEKLFNLISSVYEKHVDMAHVYAENELFTIDERQFSKKKRERMFHDYRKQYMEKGNNDQKEQNEKQESTTDNDNSNDIDGKNNDKGSSTLESEIITKTTAVLAVKRTGKDGNFYSMPKSKADIPSPEQIKTLDEEITSLQRRINQMKRYNQNLQSQLQSIHKTKSISQEMKQITTSSLGSYSNQQDGNSGSSSSGKNNRNKLQDSINAAMIGKDGLEELCKDGENIMTKLDEIKNARGDDNNTTNETKKWSEEIKRKTKEARERLDAANNRPPKKMTLEEDYKERTRNGNNRIGSICVSSNLLKK
eukprot:CAMPEP_0203681606 /NCGR_PEP_ID=MMETSP0090-20130426/43235_1 /ASSEMBLY_ACC=CAM_ASM_001088 /TAXON_ID=426623 /ORGANISM="Chaetoceros affinis, Strain CCMP159" /LENGTH=436 /DNA_ID=CAMNT_0050550155 /DNA_START=157 /DNA_END=1467 /DNA_ORIENTATION=+